MKKTNMLFVKQIGVAALLLFVATNFVTAKSTAKVSADADAAAPGTIEDASNASLAKVIALDKKLKIKDDQIVIYYVRPDKLYDNWALWIWAVPGGSGDALWSHSQKWTVKNGIGYMVFPVDGGKYGVKPISSEGKVGLIVRQKSGWTKDCEDDRVFDTTVSKKIVIYSGDPNTYAVKEYQPQIMSAVLSSENTISLVFSGKYGLATDGSASGFVVSDETGKSYAITDVINAETETHEENFAKKVTVTLAENIPLTRTLTISHPAFESSKTVDNTALAITLAEKTVPALDETLGASYDRATKSVTVKLWAPTSSAVQVNFYKDARAVKADYTKELSYDSATGVWTATFSDVDPNGLFYDFTVHNAKGTKTVLDPYAKSMAAYQNDGSAGRGAVVDMDSARANPVGGMSEPYVKLVQREDAVVYEMSVRDFTISPDSDVKGMPGTYTAFIEKIPYLKKLGVTHVQLMPVLNFYYGDETKKTYEDKGTTGGNNYNWGYDPHNYFTPEGWYATDAADPYCRVAELRTLINECHKAGIGVILDVVYNHMAGPQFLDDIVPGYYFRRTAKGGYTSASGCGNDTATEHAMMHRLVADSVAYWVKNYKVDGFRFDLMGLMESSCVLDAYHRAAAINPNELFIGEGWKMYNGPKTTVGMDQNYVSKTDSISVFNDEFRDAIKAGGFNETGKGFITGVCSSTQRLFSNCIGQPATNYKADNPGDNVQYIVCHDGMTLHDAIANNVKLDETIPEQKAELIARIKLGNFFVLTSQGIPFLHGGQERGRTKPNVTNAKNETVGKFVRNSYDSSDNINQIVWALDDDYRALLSYTTDLIALRKALPVLRMDDANSISANTKLLVAEGEDPLVLAYQITQGSSVYYICVNASKNNAVVKIDGVSKMRTVLADGKTASAQGIKEPVGVTVSESSIVLNPLTAAVIKVE